jgi:hypothetical protein
LQRQQHHDYYHDKQKTSIRYKTPVAYAFTYLNSPETAKQYPKRLQSFFEFIGLQGNLEQQGRLFLDEVRQNNNDDDGGKQWAQEHIMLYLDSLKKRVKHQNKGDDDSSSRKKGEISAGTLKNYIPPLKLFYESHNLPQINWRLISRALPKSRKASNDRAPTREEIRKVIGARDRRVKPIVLVMCSSGIRLGAWDYLRWKHVIPLKKKNDKGDEEVVIAAKLIVYTEEHDEYYTFITPEAYYALLEWMDFRALHREQITPESWLMRDKWQTADLVAKIKGGKVGLATSPKKLSTDAIKIILIRALYEQGIRQVLPDGVKRHEFKGAHGFRKFFKTHAEQVMNHSNVELLIGHAPALQASYYKPTESDILADYLKAVDELTITDYDKTTLKKQVSELAEKNEEQNYIIKGKLAEKEKDIEVAVKEAQETKKQLEDLEDRFRMFEKNTSNFITHVLGGRKLTPKEKKERDEKIRQEKEEWRKSRGIKLEVLKAIDKENEISNCVLCSSSTSYRCKLHRQRKESHHQKKES